MLSQHGDSSVFGLAEHLANLELPITIQAPKKVVRNQNLSSTPNTFGEVATFLSTPYVDDAISTDEYQNLDDAEKHIRDMDVGYWLPGRYRDKKSRKRPSEFVQSYFVFDLIDYEPEEIDSMRTKRFLAGFCPVPVTVHKNNLLDFKTFIPLIPQIWAEADHKYHEARKAYPKSKGQLNFNFKSSAAKREAEQRQTAARETMIYEPVAEVIEEWLDSPHGASAVEAGDDIVDEFEGDGGEMFVRNYVTATMIRQELRDNPIIRDLKMNPDKIIGQALRSLGGWEGVGYVHRIGKKARWVCREGLDNHQEYVPASSVRGLGAAPAEPEKSVDDLLGV